MNNQLTKIAITMALTVTAAAFITGCNRVEPVPATASPTTVGTELDDTVITTRVKSALLADQDIKGFDIKVETRKGMVLLSGFVDNQSQIDRVMSVTRIVEGVRDVENRMTLKDGAATIGNKLDDGIVTTKVKSALLADASIKSAQIAVVTRKGEVQLSGFLDNQMQIDRAIAVAGAIEGVRKVVNEMSIKK